MPPRRPWRTPASQGASGRSAWRSSRRFAAKAASPAAATSQSCSGASLTCSPPPLLRQRRGLNASARSSTQLFRLRLRRSRCAGLRWRGSCSPRDRREVVVRAAAGDTAPSTFGPRPLRRARPLPAARRRLGRRRARFAAALRACPVRLDPGWSARDHVVVLRSAIAGAWARGIEHRWPLGTQLGERHAGRRRAGAAAAGHGERQVQGPPHGRAPDGAHLAAAHRDQPGRPPRLRSEPHVLLLALAAPTSVAQLRTRRADRTLPLDECLARVVSHLGGGDDFSVGSMRLSLQCTLSHARVTTPARATGAATSSASTSSRTSSASAPRASQVEVPDVLARRGRRARG